MTEVKEPQALAASAQDVALAERRIHSLVVHTPVLESAELSQRLGCRLYFKCENLQVGGAFKFRGAANAIIGLLEKERPSGVVTHSSGNHGNALARAAALHDLPAHVVVPEGAIQSKVDAIAAAGAILHRCAPNQAAREAAMAELVGQGLTPVPPYDHPLVIAGQGTAALELCRQQPGLDMIITPVGGGGLLAGTCLAASLESSPPQVLGAEPAGADDAHRSLEAGQRLTDFTPETIADGLRATIGALTFPIIRRHVQHIITVDDALTLEAMRLLWSELKLVVEPSSATVLAAVMAEPDRFAGKRLGLILTGGNVDFDKLPFLEKTG